MKIVTIFTRASTMLDSPLSLCLVSPLTYARAVELSHDGEVANRTLILYGRQLLAEFRKFARDRSDDEAGEHERCVKFHRLQRMCTHRRMYRHDPADLSDNFRKLLIFVNLCDMVVK